MSTNRNQNSNGKHPVYHGIRSRSGKWVSEIREPRKTTRIWLGTYSTPEMAAAAHDAAAIALKGSRTSLNFPEMAYLYPVPASTSASDIRDAAASAAMLKQPHSGYGSGYYTGQPGNGESSRGVVDEEEVLNMPYLMADMAEGMLMDPPPMNTPSFDYSYENYDGGNLWSYQ